MEFLRTESTDVAGSEFHTMGAYEEKARVPKDFAKRSVFSIFVAVDLMLIGRVQVDICLLREGGCLRLMALQ